LSKSRRKVQACIVRGAKRHVPALAPPAAKKRVGGRSAAVGGGSFWPTPRGGGPPLRGLGPLESFPRIARLSPLVPLAGSAALAASGGYSHQQTQTFFASAKEILMKESFIKDGLERVC